MRKLLFILTIVMAGTAVAVITGCEEDPKEACEQDLFCEDTMEVTACCTDGADCYYTYNGIDYPDTTEGLSDLVAALDCTKKKSISVEGDNDDMMARLQAMLEEARIRSRQ